MGAQHPASQAGGDEALVFSMSELDPQMAQAGDGALDVLESATRYLLCGGTGNLIECVKFLSDRLLLTGYGYR